MMGQYREYLKRQERKQAWFSFIWAIVMTIILIGFVSMIVDALRGYQL